MTPKHMKLLVVDDDINILRMMQRILELEGYEVVTASNGDSALEIFSKTGFALVLLDIIMPGKDGLSVCKAIRQTSNTPIIMVTAKGGISEKLQGFEAGVDDYVTKPFPAKELAARVNAVLRRSISNDNKDPSPIYKYKNLEIDFERKLARINSKILDLTATEFRLLAYLANNPFKVIASETILQQVWGEDYINDIHLLQVNIGRLRQKMKELDHNIKYIETKPGQGYLLNPEANGQ
jgi:DNA-binding response OmpR family regulator